MLAGRCVRTALGSATVEQRLSGVPRGAVASVLTAPCDRRKRLQHNAIGQCSGDICVIIGWADLDNVDADDRQLEADPPHRVQELASRQAARLGGAGARRVAGVADVDVDREEHTVALVHRDDEGLGQALLQPTFLPAAEGVEFTHAWGGPLGIARDWHPSVGYDPSTGMGHAGGYVGDGVALTNLAGRTLADLVTTRDTALTRLPWVQHRSRRWEPEPLRWLGVNAGLQLANLADREERLTGRPALLGGALSALTSH